MLSRYIPLPIIINITIINNILFHSLNNYFNFHARDLSLPNTRTQHTPTQSRKEMILIN